MTDRVEQHILLRLQVHEPFPQLRQLHGHIRQALRESRAVLLVLDAIVVDDILVALHLRKDEVGDAYHIHRLEAERLRAGGEAVVDGEGGVEDEAVVEVVLVAILHLDDDVFLRLCLAVDVEDRSAGVAPQAGHILAGQFYGSGVEVRQDGVDQPKQEVLVALPAEDKAEGEIKAQVDETDVLTPHLEVFFTGAVDVFHSSVVWSLQR